ncbi:Fe-S cluster assembly protein SufD [Aureimonas sp. AU12]|uniref:Fe-S cluster assembly protein SufD n=1 Tax=Aureimonas sp. AU12 TaxID=1638161 RepID=UPI000784854E|nr:Fe-S cluster assembly protein SufD [Aureimonas sp. AU12]
MSVVTAPTRTAAELALIERAEMQASGTARQQSALELLRAEGLPSRRVEAWHYTDLRALMGRRADVSASASTDASYLTPFLPHSAIVDLGSEPAGNDLAPGVSIALATDAADWNERVNHLDRPFDTLRVVNAALGAKGTSIAIADGADVTQPIELRSQPDSRGGQSFSAVSVGSGAKAVIVERQPMAGSSSLSSSIHTLDIGDGSDILWIIVQEKGADETHLGQLNVTLRADSKFRLFVLNAGGAIIRQEVHAVTVGEGADIQIRGVNLLQAGQHVDVTTTLYHNVAHTTSTEIFRNVLLGGHGVFQGMIRVAKGAQKTDARLACNTLLLSDEGEFSAKPELEIFADDVQCGHGATAGEINADHLFYLMSRGIPEAAARALLVKAFVGEVVEELEYQPAIEALEARIDAWLALPH